MRAALLLLALLCVAPRLSAAPSLSERFPSLTRQIEANREQWLEHALAAARLADYCADGNDELWKGMELVLLERHYLESPGERNCALTLLLWLLSQGAYTRGDPITAALASANAFLYASGDEAVRAELRRDVLAHYRLYRAVTEWQEGWSIGYRLVSTPLMAKLLWCYRSNQLEQNGDELTLAEYHTFVDRIDVLEDMQAWIRSSGSVGGTSLAGIVLAIDAAFRSAYRYAHFMAMIRQWYAPSVSLGQEATDQELYAALSSRDVSPRLPDWAREVLEDFRTGAYYVEILGRRRDPQARMWLNYQWGLFRETGAFRGDCGTETEVESALWKAAGIAALAVYHTGTGIGHAYPMYYDPFLDRFRSLQDLSFMVEKYGPSIEVVLHPMPLRLHDRASALRPRPRAEARSYARFVSRGIDRSLLEGMYLVGALFGRSEAVFTQAACPSVLPDADRDGIRDEDEAALGTRADRADTDQDGFEDLWEVERRFDPASTASPGRIDLSRVLIGQLVEISSVRTGEPLDVEGAGRKLYRIVRSDEAQYHFIVGARSGLALGSRDRGTVGVGPLTGSPSQKWKLLFREGGSFAIQSRADGGVMALDGGQELVLRRPQNTRDELWLIR